MVGIFSRFSSRNGHRRAQSAIDAREGLPSASEATTGAIATAASISSVTHGIEIATEFKPIDRPLEPLDNDQPVQCPLPEPSILNCYKSMSHMGRGYGAFRTGSNVFLLRLFLPDHQDGRIWKERVSSVSQRRSDTPAMQKRTSTGSDTLLRKPPLVPSISAPEHNMLKLLDECNASGNFLPQLMVAASQLHGTTLRYNLQTTHEEQLQKHKYTSQLLRLWG
ncbi:hypothetical protein SASPL_127841 [Salvia splendens]|uniref:Uncharacterized protein n=1 Tax=Salvia splendens TaxID=180675 RepID=A0A8X8ZMX8_SALSN|nr:hypothetical protein SASPL_127841 [Salvia splendens]